MAEPEETTANPLRAELDDLLRAARSAVERVPGMSSPLAAIGDGHAWKGPAARRFRDTHVSPVKSALYPALTRLVDDIEAVRNGQPRDVSPEQASALRREWGLR